MDIKLTNCNNIDEGSIHLVEKKLNIKYAMNGTGKSTIAKAIVLSKQDKNTLLSLIPFKYRKNEEPDKYSPKVEGVETVNSVMVFNDDYINQFVFRQDEVISKSFEIFIKSPSYDQHIEEIENLISEIKGVFKKNEAIDQMIADLVNLSDSFGKSKTGYSAAGSLAKGIGKGNKVVNIPKGLENYGTYLRSDKNVQWLKWQITGNDFINLSDHCPYCTSPIESKKENIVSVSKEYDAKSIEHLNKILSLIDSLGNYFTPEANERLRAITKNINGLSTEEISYLLRVKEQIDELREKLIALKGLTFFSFNDVDKVIDKFSDYKIKLEYMTDLNSKETKKIIDSVNASLDVVISKAGILQGEINKQKLGIQETIKLYRGEIDSFLRNAGYKYSVDIELEDEQYKMKLRHIDFSEPVLSGAQHLSYGEKNAFALVLFMYECIVKKPDLIILDDPISSFDRNKKYAIIDMLFRRKRSLKGKTVLMMTHDLEPIVDLLYNLPHKFEPVPFVTYLESKKNILKEIDITANDIMTFGQICEENIRSLSEDIVKLVYLRRYYEVLNNMGVIYQLLSNLLHRREVPVWKLEGKEIPMSASEIESASNEIKQKIPNFDYRSLLSQLNDLENMRSVYRNVMFNYEKLQIYRIVFGETSGSDILNKFINETFHIENEYIMQLNPCKYEIIPQFIIEECDRQFEGKGEKLIK